MNLQAYLKTSGDTAAKLAQRVGVSAASISRIRRGDQNISLSLAHRICRETGGKVTLKDLAVELAA